MQYAQYINFAVTIILILIIFWFAESQKKSQDKKIKKMQDSIKVNDKIVTYTGLSGIVKEVLEDRVIIKLNPSEVEVSIEKWAIAGLDDRVINKKEAKQKEESK